MGVQIERQIIQGQEPSQVEPPPGTNSPPRTTIPEMLTVMHPNKSMPPQTRTFIDLFSGCGGFSLGISQAGWRGAFAIERATDAFETFRANFLSKESAEKFQWPAWLEAKAHSIDEVLANHRGDLAAMRGSVDLIVGGPPCQGFSFSGKRDGDDPRNQMFERYVEFVSILGPKALVLENVPGMRVVHSRNTADRRTEPSYLDKLLSALEAAGYVSAARILDASEFGVPQRRMRLFVVGLRKDVAEKLPRGAAEVFELIEEARAQQCAHRGALKLVTAGQAISDLEAGRGRIKCDDPASPRGFRMPKYLGPRTQYQREFHDNLGADKMDSTRLANHTDRVKERFRKLLRLRRAVNISAADRVRLGMLKHRLVTMHKDEPAPTITTLPDDILHYSEPRILSVRECARLQSFPDSFVFRGKYTTGGKQRKVECPRYTQVGNAVPPLLASIIGRGLSIALGKVSEYDVAAAKIANRQMSPSPPHTEDKPEPAPA